MKKKYNKIEQLSTQDLKSESSLMQNQQKPDLLDFDTWHAMRQAEIPPQHKKEVLKADFKARGLESMATLEQFDQALALYGVKL